MPSVALYGLWASLISESPNNSYCKFGEDLFHKAKPHFRSLTHLRGVSNTIIGICSYLKVHSNDSEMLETLNYLTGILTDAYSNSRTDTWRWFEDYLTYDNAILPLALLQSAEITRNEEVPGIAFESMRIPGNGDYALEIL